MKYLISIISVFFYLSGTEAQQVRLSGYVKDSLSGESLIGATIYDDHSERGTTSNQYGFFNLTVNKQLNNVWVSYIGYNPVHLILNFQTDTTITVLLAPNLEIEEVSVYHQNQLHRKTASGEIYLPLARTKLLPVFLGEPDIMKTIQLLPGVQSGVEGSAGLHIRGGSPDQNLILLDDVPVYNVSHLLGFFSVFNTNALQNVTFYKGGIPARYGGRTSSVIDIKMKEGNINNTQFLGSIGLLSSQFMVEGPIIKKKVGYMVSARRTYHDLLFRPVLKAWADMKAGYFFYDFNAKVNAILNSKDRIYISLYTGTDKGFLTPDLSLKTNENVLIKWGNFTSSVRWNHIYKKGIFSIVTLAWTKYRYLNERSFTSESNSLFSKTTTASNTYFSGINDFLFKTDFDHSLGNNHRIRYGANIVYHLYKPGVTGIFSISEGIDSVITARNINSVETRFYVEDELRLGKYFELNAGINASMLSVDDTAYASFEPRISGIFHMNNKISLRASYTSMTQYMNLLTSAYIGLPTDMWIPSTHTLPPQKANQYDAGLHLNLPWMNLSVGGYYKKMTGLVEYKEGASYLLGKTSWEDLITTGDGESYGLEFIAERSIGKLSGWISYTLSKNQRHFPDIDPSFPYKYDRRHNLAITGRMQFPGNKNISFTWLYHSGENITLSNARYLSQPALWPWNNPGDFNFFWPSFATLENITDRNGYSTEPYHRLDIGYNFSNEKKWGVSSWSFGIYNLYNRQNAFFLMMYEKSPGDIKLMKYSFTPIMPYFRYEFKF
ncbi:hypothetical protein ES708_06166 [subsurface metagenome]